MSTHNKCEATLGYDVLFQNTHTQSQDVIQANVILNVP